MSTPLTDTGYQRSDRPAHPLELGDRVPNDRRNGWDPSDAGAALFRFTDRLFRAGSLADVCDASLDAFGEALGCERSSVLLFDPSGLMRFVAWRGLSDGYRRAVEGHSPWTKDTRDPQPICIGDIDDADLAEDLKETVRSEGIRALAFVPVMANGELAGKFMTYYASPHAFDPSEIDLAVAIARQLGFSLEKMRAEEALRTSQAQLLSELAATKRLQSISTELIHEDDVGVLYERILDAAANIMKADFASMQMLYPERGELRLLAHRGFDPAAAAFWEWVRPGAGCTCGASMRSGKRTIVPDIETCDFMAGTADLFAYRKAGMRALQSTPLVSRTGRLLGMISTHWSRRHNPTEQQLGLLDVLARQAADLIERKESEGLAQRARERQELLTQEIQHRTKNIFAVVQAVISRSFAGKQTVAEAEQAVMSRIYSLAQSHVMLIEKEWHGADIAEVVRMELRPYADRVITEGPQILLSARAAQNFALAVHELATNAAKYGALSNSTGRVHVSWSTGKLNGRHLFEFRWQEQGGPEVKPPQRKGFGSTVLEQVMAEYFETPPEIFFKAEGLLYELKGSLDAITAQN